MLACAASRRGPGRRRSRGASRPRRRQRATASCCSCGAQAARPNASLCPTKRILRQAQNGEQEQTGRAERAAELCQFNSCDVRNACACSLFTSHVHVLLASAHVVRGACVAPLNGKSRFRKQSTSLAPEMRSYGGEERRHKQIRHQSMSCGRWEPGGTLARENAHRAGNCIRGSEDGCGRELGRVCMPVHSLVHARARAGSKVTWRDQIPPQWGAAPSTA